MKRRSFLKKTLGFTLAFLGLSGGTFYYSREVEPSFLQVQKEDIYSPKITSAFHNKKMIQFSDTHIGFHYSLEDLTNLVQTINQMSPDIIVFTGDLIDDPRDIREENRIGDILSQLKAPNGKFWVYGNHDHGGYGTEKVLQIMTEAGFSLLQNNHIVIEENSQKIIMAGIDDMMLGKPDLDEALSTQTASHFTILLAHEPDYADIAKNYPIDIQLSGHSHGGQIRLPVIGHLYTPLYAEKYVLGKYQINSNFKLFVNGGIGTTRIPYRLFCKPEIHEFTLKTKMS